MLAKRLIWAVLTFSLTGLLPVFSESMKEESRFGTLEVAKNAGAVTPYTVLLNGKKILGIQNDYASIHGIFKARDHDIAVIKSQCGGTSCGIEDLILVTIHGPAVAKVIEDKQLRSGDGTLKISFAGDRLNFDLGYEDGKKKSASFAEGKLTITLERAARVAALDVKSCQWIYDQVLDGCISARQRDPSCKDPGSDFSMALVRGLKSIAQSPSFDSVRFSALCRAACDAGRAPRFEQMKSYLCDSK